jgi:hypothetical protein
MTSIVMTEFPDYDGELPDIYGFADSSYHHDTCPSLTNSELGLQLFVDYVDPASSEYPESRTSGELGRYRLLQLDGGEDLANTDDLGDVLAAIAKLKNTATPFA